MTVLDGAPDARLRARFGSLAQGAVAVLTGIAAMCASASGWWRKAIKALLLPRSASCLLFNHKHLPPQAFHEAAVGRRFSGALLMTELHPSTPGETFPAGSPPVVHPATASSKGRPIGVALIAAVQAITAIIAGVEMAIGDRGLPGESVIVFSVAGAVTAASGLTVAIGLWRLQRWAWTATMLWVGAAMTSALIAYFRGEPSYLLMAMTVVQVFYLNQSDVQQVFRRRKSRNREPM